MSVFFYLLVLRPLIVKKNDSDNRNSSRIFDSNYENKRINESKKLYLQGVCLSITHVCCGFFDGTNAILFVTIIQAFLFLVFYIRCMSFIFTYLRLKHDIYKTPNTFFLQPYSHISVKLFRFDKHF
jgi:hypothetical protein